MAVKPLVGFRDELPIKPFLAAARFVTCYEKDGFTFRVEGESNAPNSTSGIES
jgi:hypothetical protein